MNAKEELIKHIELDAGFTFKDVICVDMVFGEIFQKQISKQLKTGFTGEDLFVFVSSIDFDYDNGYGSQYLSGNIWYKDGTYSERGEYDGSEWWEYKKAPPIPESCKEVQ